MLVHYGIDIAGREAGYPPSQHLNAFEYLRGEHAHYTIHAGEAFGLLGPNGAGKTSAFHAVTGLLPTTGGRIELDGTPMAVGDRRLRRAMGVVFQQPALLHVDESHGQQHQQIGLEPPGGPMPPQQEDGGNGKDPKKLPEAARPSRKKPQARS